MGTLHEKSVNVQNHCSILQNREMLLAMKSRFLTLSSVSEILMTRIYVLYGIVDGC